MSRVSQSDLPVAVIGGGPVGLAAAAHLMTRGVPVKLYEAGESVAANVRDWGHVRLFSPWGFNTDTAATAILREYGWQSPAADALPTGHDLYEAYLKPLAETPALRPVIETGARVRNVSRHGIDKVVSRGRGDYPFALAIDESNGRSRIDLARAVIDASGTWTNPIPRPPLALRRSEKSPLRIGSLTASPMCSGVIARSTRDAGCSCSAAGIRPQTCCLILRASPKPMLACKSLGPYGGQSGACVRWRRGGQAARTRQAGRRSAAPR